LAAYIALITMSLLVLATLFYFRVVGDYFNIQQSAVVHYLLNLERGSLKVLWVTYQIIVASTSSIGIQVFTNILKYYDVILYIECVVLCS
jgi:hypothetical protein